MFKYPSLLKFSEHADLRLLENNDYSHARGVLLTPIVYTEMAEVAREYPIVFPDNQSDMPHAMLGLEAGQNAYIGSDGRWLANYIPLTIRQYPFGLQRAAAAEGAKQTPFTLMFDPQAPQLGKTHGQPIFTDDGQLGPHMDDRIKLLEQVQKGVAATQHMVRALRTAGILIEKNIIVRHGAQARNLTGMLVVDEAKLNTLPDEAFNGLRKQGALPLAYAHLLSWANFRQGALAGKYPELSTRAVTDEASFKFGDGTLSFSSLN